MHISMRTITALVLIAASGPAAAANPHDGNWRVEIRATTGSCTPDGSIRVVVANGTVQPVGLATVSASGLVQPDGKVALTLSNGVGSARAEGRLQRSRGSGSWAVGMGSCAGRWTAVREL